MEEVPPAGLVPETLRAEDWKHLLVDHRYHFSEDFLDGIKKIVKNIFEKGRDNGRTKDHVFWSNFATVLEYAACDAFGFEKLPFGGIEMADVRDPATGARFEIKRDSEPEWWTFYDENLIQLGKAVEVGRTDFVLTGRYRPNIQEGYVDCRFRMVIEAQCMFRKTGGLSRVYCPKSNPDRGPGFSFFSHYNAARDGYCVHRR